MMNVSLLKIITILSCIIGIICGFVALLPYLGGFAFFTTVCLSSLIVIILLMRSGVLKLDTIPESLTIGAIIGFISYLAFSIIYIPLVILMIRVFHYATNYGISIILGHANLFVILVLSIFMAVISATINAFTAFMIYYITEVFNNMNNK